jgi:transposase
MSKKRRNHSPEFKSKVALAAIKGDQSLTELSQQYGINSNLIVKWKKPLIEQSSEVFASGKGLAPDRDQKFSLCKRRLVN